MVVSRRFESFIRALAYSPDGAFVAIGYGGRLEGASSTVPGHFHILNSATLVTEATSTELKEPIRAMQYSLDGGLLALGCETGAVHLYGVAGNFVTKKYSFTGLGAPAAFLDFSVDGSYIQVSNFSWY